MERCSWPWLDFKNLNFFFKFKTLIYNYCLCNGKRLFSRSFLLISQGCERLAGNFFRKSVNRYHRPPYHNQRQLSLNLPRIWLDMETRQTHLSLLMTCWGIWQFALWLLNLSLPHKVAEDSGLSGYKILIFLTYIKFRLGVFFLQIKCRSMQTMLYSLLLVTWSCR